MRLILIAFFVANSFSSSVAMAAGQGTADHGWSDAEPTVTRNGMLRFITGPDFVPGAVPEILERLENGDEGTLVRAALVEALRRTGAEAELWGSAVAKASLQESDAYVRMTMVDTLRRVPMTAETNVQTALEASLASPNVEVRAAGARTIGGHAQGKLMANQLIAAMDDTAPEVRQSATQAVGWLTLDAAFGPLQARLSDDDALTRARALRALGRIDSHQAAKLPQVRLMVADTDPRVVRAAQILLD